MSGVKWDQAFEISARLQAALVRTDHKESMDKYDYKRPETLSLPPKKRLPLNVRAGINSDLECLNSNRTDYSEIYTDPKHFSLLKWLESNDKQHTITSKHHKDSKKRKPPILNGSALDESSSVPCKSESPVTKTAIKDLDEDLNSDDESEFKGFQDDGVQFSFNQLLLPNVSKFRDSDNDSSVSGFAGFSDDGTDPGGFEGFPDDGWNFCSLKVKVTDEHGFFGFSCEDYVHSVEDLECMNRTVTLERMCNSTDSEYSYPESDCLEPTTVSEMGVDRSVAEKDPVAFEYDDITMSDVLSSHSEEY